MYFQINGIIGGTPIVITGYKLKLILLIFFVPTYIVILICVLICFIKCYTYTRVRTFSMVTLYSILISYNMYYVVLCIILLCYNL